MKVENIPLLVDIDWYSIMKVENIPLLVDIDWYSIMKVEVEAVLYL